MRALCLLPRFGEVQKGTTKQAQMHSSAERGRRHGAFRLQLWSVETLRVDIHGQSQVALQRHLRDPAGQRVL